MHMYQHQSIKQLFQNINILNLNNRKINFIFNYYCISISILIQDSKVYKNLFFLNIFKLN